MNFLILTKQRFVIFRRLILLPMYAFNVSDTYILIGRRPYCCHGILCRISSLASFYICNSGAKLYKLLL